MKKLFLLLTLFALLSVLLACTDNDQSEATAPDGTASAEPTTASAQITTQIITTSPSITTAPGSEAAELEPGSVYLIRHTRYFTLGTTSFGTVRGEKARFTSIGYDLDKMWRIEALGDGTYNIVNASAGLYLSAKDTDDSVVLEKKDKNGLQSWSITDKGEGFVIGLPDGRYLSAESNKKSCDAMLTDSVEEAIVWSLEKKFEKDTNLPSVLMLNGNIGAPASCPEVYKGDDGYYYNINMTAGMRIKRSKDLVTWMNIGAVFNEIPSWIEEELGYDSIWAPGYYEVGDKLCVYYCASTGGSQNSLIGLAYAETPHGPFTDMGMVIRSETGDPYNCIDPCIFTDDDGKVYLIFGSYWTGVYMRRIDPETGLLHKTDTTLWHLAEGKHEMEAPNLVKRGDYYYLFVAMGSLSSGTNYHWAVGRSESLFGPYLDKNGKPMLEGYTTALSENKNGIESAAHAQPFLDDDGQWYMVSEMWPDMSDPHIQLHISKIVWTEDGWPVTALSPNIVKDIAPKEE